MPNFELKLEIPNIMFVCKFEINWSTNKNLRALTTNLGRTDGRLAFPYPPLRFAGEGDKKGVDRGNLSTFYRKHNPFEKKNTSKLDENKNYIYLSNTHNFGNWAPFRTLFEIK